MIFLSIKIAMEPLTCLIPCNVKPYKTPTDIIADLKLKQLSFIDETAAEKY